MNEKQVDELLSQWNGRYKELSDLLIYAPFNLDEEKNKQLVKYLDDVQQIIEFGSDFFKEAPDNDEIAQEAKKDSVKYFQELADILKKGDKHVPKNLIDDIEEARLYKKRYPNPDDAFDEAKKIYGLDPDLILL